MSIEYRPILNKALFGFIKTILTIIQNQGLGEEQLFYITFLVNHPGVELSDMVKEKYPTEITIVLQYQFEDLLIHDDDFTVKLRFNDCAETIRVPFESIINVFDPSDNFYLNIVPSPAKITEDTSDITYDKDQVVDNKTQVIDNQDDKIISLEQFRNKNKIH